MISHDDLVARDGDRCAWCRKPVPADQRTRDHLVPVSAGGSNASSNLVLACGRCNQLRGATNAVEWELEIVRALAQGKPEPALVARSRLKARGRYGIPFPPADNQSAEIREATERIARFSRSLKSKRPKPPAPVYDHAAVLGGPRLSPVLRHVGYQQSTIRTRHFRVRVMVDGDLVDRCGWCTEPWPCPAESPAETG